MPLAPRPMVFPAWEVIVPPSRFSFSLSTVSWQFVFLILTSQKTVKINIVVSSTLIISWAQYWQWQKSSTQTLNYYYFFIGSLKFRNQINLSSNESYLIIFRLVLTRSNILWFQKEYVIFSIFNNNDDDNNNNKNTVVNISRQFIISHIHPIQMGWWLIHMPIWFWYLPCGVSVIIILTAVEEIM